MEAPWDDRPAYPLPGSLPPGSGAGKLFEPIDLQFARLMEKMAAQGTRGVGEAAALVSRFTRLGHTCVDLGAYAGLSLDGGAALPDVSAWREILLSSGVAGEPGEYRPLVIDGSSRLYLWRYWSYQQTLAEGLLALSRGEAAFDEGEVGRTLSGLFPAPAEKAAIDWQKVAVLLALKGRLSIVTGGPGTGKTTVVAKLLALLGAAAGRPDVALAAPTGKAAQRMEEAVRKTFAETSATGFPDCRELRASTLHRLLGIVPGRARARHSQSRPLPHDVVVVDEASMVSLALMSRLVGALKPGSRLVLVGDRNQLASVEPGHVMGDICGETAAPRYSPGTCALVRRVAGYELPGGRPRGMQDCLVELKTAYRFGPDSGIRALWEAVKNGDPGACRELFSSGGMTDVLVSDHGKIASFSRALEPVVLEGYAPFLEETDAAVRLTLFGGFRVLCALREGPYGVSGLNRLIEKALAASGLIRPSGLHYHGRPVLVTANDYAMNLFNGDIGLVLRDENGELGCFFPGPGAALRKVSVARLPEHETAYAMTVHKSQGSEFSKVALVLPPGDSPVLTRELLYTGITRAREHLDLWASPGVIASAVARRTERISGLGDLLARDGKKGP